METHSAYRSSMIIWCKKRRTNNITVCHTNIVLLSKTQDIQSQMKRLSML